MSGQGSRPTVQNINSAPWGPAQDFIRRSFDRAWQLQDDEQGFNPYPGSTVAPYSGETQQGIGGMFRQAGGGTPTTNAALANARNVINSGGMTGQMQGALTPLENIASGQNAIQAGQYLTPTARGDYLDSPNPYLMQRLGTAADEVTNRVNQQFAGAGRLGSGAMQDRLAGSLGDLYSGALSQDYQQERGRQLGAAGQLANIQGANIANQAGAARNLFGLGDQAQRTALSYSGLAPTLEQAQYNPYQQMLTAGALRDDMQSRVLQDEVRRWEGAENAPWTRLANYSGIVNQGGALGGTGTTTVQQPGTSPWLTALYGGSALLGGLGSFGRGFGFGG